MSIEYGASMPTRSEWRLPGALLTLYGLIWLALAVAPVSREDWLLENLLVRELGTCVAVLGKRDGRAENENSHAATD